MNDDRRPEIQPDPQSVLAVKLGGLFAGAALSSMGIAMGLTLELPERAARPTLIVFGLLCAMAVIAVLWRQPTELRAKLWGISVAGLMTGLLIVWSA